MTIGPRPDAPQPPPRRVRAAADFLEEAAVHGGRIMPPFSALTVETGKSGSFVDLLRERTR